VRSLLGDMNARQQSVAIVVPVHSEQATLGANVEFLLDYLRSEFPFRCSVTIADNASSDETRAIADELAGQWDELAVVRLEEKGRGRAIRQCWLASGDDVVSYMDVDLSTNLESFLPLVAPIMSGHSELAIGTRLVRQANVRRR